MRENGSRSHRLSDEAPTKRPPIIVTTKHAAGSGGGRSGSPSRDPYRSSDEGQYYTQPATSIPRGRGSAHPSSTTIDSDEYQRLRDRTEHDRLLGPRTTDTFRSSRPAVLYSTSHRAGTLEFDDEGYEYTKPGELARYDLDHDRDKPRRSRRESLDRYYRPTVSVTTDLARPYEQNERRQRGPPPTTWGLDKVNRTPAAGIYDGAGTRMPVLPAAPLPPDLPRRNGASESPRSPERPERRAASRTRPISLIQDPAVRPSHHHPDDHYRSQERDRDRDRDRDHDFFQDRNITTRGFGIRVNPRDLEEPRHHHEPPMDVRRDRRDIRNDFGDPEMRKRSYDDLDIVSRRYDERDLVRERDYEWDGERDRERERPKERDRERPIDRERERDRERDQERDRDQEWDRERDRDRNRDRDREHRTYRDRERDYDPNHDADVRPKDDSILRPRDDARVKDTAVPEDEQDTKRDRFRDKVASGFGITAASMGIVTGLKDKVKDGKEEKDVSPSPIKGRRDEGIVDREKFDDDRRMKPARKEALLDDEDFEFVEHPKDRDLPPKILLDKPPVDSRGRERTIVDEDAVAVAKRDETPPTDEEKEKPKPTGRRRHRASSAFDPNDATALAELKAQLAAQEERKKSTKQIPSINEPSPERKSERLQPLEVDDTSAVSASSSKDESRGRELALPIREEKQVRVVSPPRDKEEKKPIKGILKQPKSQFPEEPNPIREGVAPHKDDKTKSDVPQGARWTKISRKMVNPEALTIGKERFEVRDDFVIVLRVLSKEEIQAYAAATATLRERRLKEYRREQKEPRDVEYEEKDGEEHRRIQRHHRIEQDDDRRDRDRDRERERGEREKERPERHRRHKRESDDEDEYRPRSEYHSHRRSHRDRDRDAIYTEAD